MLVIISCITNENYLKFNLIHVHNIGFRESIYKDFFQPNKLPPTMTCIKHDKILILYNSISMWFHNRKHARIFNHGIKINRILHSSS